MKIFQPVISYFIVFGLGVLLSAGYSENPLGGVLFLLSGGFGFWLILRLRFKAVAGFLFGLGYFLSLIDWLRVIGDDAWVGLSILSAAWWALGFGFGNQFLKIRFGSVLFATWFMTFELLRDRFPWGGFGWGQFGVVFINLPIAEKLIPFLGQVLLGWLLVFLWVWLARNYSQIIKQWKRVGLGLLALLLFPSIPVSALSQEYVAGVQGGVVYHPLGEYGPAGEVLNKHLEITLQNESELRDAEMVIWPESAVDIDVTRYPDSDALLQALADRLQTPLLINSVTRLENDKVLNATYLYRNSNREFVYAKQRLVPFGEFLPLRSLVARLTDRAAFMPRDFQPGSKPDAELINPAAIAICFEIADDQIAAQQSDTSYLIVQTNNATYQAGDQSNQQLLITRFRAAELRLPTLTIATSGISASISARGEVIDLLDKTDRGVLKLQIPEQRIATPAATISIIAPWLLWGLTALSLLTRIKVKP